MTPYAFRAWLAAMIAAGLATSDADCARLLGVTTRHIWNMKHKGASRQTALACAALLRKMKPYGE